MPPRIFKTKKPKAKFTATDATLPLGVLIHEFNPTTGKYGPNVNPNLHLLFAEFARYLDVKTSTELYNDVFNKWIKNFLEKNASDKPIVDGDKYRLDNINSAALLLTRFDQDRTTSGENIVFMYLGLYFFVIWYLAVKTATGTPAILSTDIMNYVTEQLMTLRRGTLKIAKDFFMDSHRNYTANYLSAFQTNKPLVLLGSLSSLGDIWNHVNGLSSSSSPKLRNDITCAAVAFFKETIDHVATEELKRLLWYIDADALVGYEDMSALTIGNGSGTIGFFNQESLGIIFFKYRMSPDANNDKKPEAFPRYLGIRGIADEYLWCAAERPGNAPAMFIAYIGFNGIDAASVLFDANDLQGSRIGAKTFKIQGMDFKGKNYFPDDKISSTAFVFSAPANVSPKQENTGEIHIKAVSGLDEITFLLFQHHLFLKRDSPQIPSVSVAEHFLNNEFGIAMSVWQAYWNTAEDEGKVDQIIHAIKNKPATRLIATCDGGGIGRVIEGHEVGVGGPGVAPAPDRSDNGIPDTQAKPENDPLRYSFGEICWHDSFGGQENVVEFTAMGFVSPLRCTWGTWSFFDGIDPKTGVRKRDTLEADIGKYLRDSLHKGPSYNAALSAFRAFSILEAMISRLKQRIAILALPNAPSDKKLTSQEASDLIDRLDTLLNSASFPVFQPGTKDPTDIVVNYELFHRYLD